MPSSKRSVVMSVRLSLKLRTAASSPIPFCVEGWMCLMSLVRCLISPNSPNVEISVLAIIVVVETLIGQLNVQRYDFFCIYARVQKC